MKNIIMLNGEEMRIPNKKYVSCNELYDGGYCNHMLCSRCIFSITKDIKQGLEISCLEKLEIIESELIK